MLAKQTQALCWAALVLDVVSLVMLDSVMLALIFLPCPTTLGPDESRQAPEECAAMRVVALVGFLLFSALVLPHGLLAWFVFQRSRSIMSRLSPVTHGRVSLA